MEIIPTLDYNFRVLDDYGNILETFSKYEDAVAFARFYRDNFTNG